MSMSRLAFQGVRRNARSYLAYFLCNVIIVTTLFLSNILNTHPLKMKYLSGIVDYTLIERILNISSFSQSVYIPILLLFLFFSISFFLQVQKKEIAQFLLHGASFVQLSIILFLKQMLIGVATIISGIILGLSLSKLFFILIAPLTSMPRILPFYFPLNAMFWTGLMIGGLFLLSALITILLIRFQKVISLLQGKSFAKSRAKSLFFVIGIVMLGVGKGFYAMDWDEGYILIPCFCIGSYFVIAHLGAFIQQLGKWNNSPTYLLWGARQRFQSKASPIAGVLAAFFFFIAIFFTHMVISDIHKKVDQPTKSSSFTYILVLNSSGKNQPYKDEIRLNQMLDQEKVSYKYKKFDALWLDGVERTKVLQYSNYQALTAMTGQKKRPTLQDNEVLYLYDEYTNRKQQNDRVSKVLELAGISKPVQVHRESIKLFSYVDTIVVSDNTYAKLSRLIKPTELTGEEPKVLTIRYLVYLVPKWMKSDPKYGSPEFNISQRWEKTNNLIARDPLFTGENEGLFGAIISFIAAVSFLYFRNRVEQMSDEEQYRILAKLGWSRLETRRLGTCQMIYLYFGPFLLAAGLHFLGASILFTRDLPILLWISIGLQCLLLILYFLFARMLYLRKVTT
ncbi:FtsX-like permease family protein [Shimazuella kribbensis]|uniref:FtsX-like permease family protein n=1 Tax=Shimazuella kribbensis TaxID=139808 RepID=UPI000405AF2F|nr:ABC transporter permease [Shimazuella kribbensis]